MDWDFWILVATIASPITGVIAIIVALALSRSSSRDAQKQIDTMRQSTKEQIDAMRNILDAFIASQAPNMLAALRQYEQQLENIDEKIEEAEDDFDVVNPFYGRGPKIEDIEYEQTKGKQAQHITDLKQKRKEIYTQLSLIRAFLERQQ